MLLAESRGVEPHPISENLVFKASRRTNPAALLSVYMVPDVWFEQTTYRLQGECSTTELIGLGIPQETRTLTNGFGDRRAAITLGRNKIVGAP